MFDKWPSSDEVRELFKDMGFDFDFIYLDGPADESFFYIDFKRGGALYSLDCYAGIECNIHCDDPYLKIDIINRQDMLIDLAAHLSKILTKKELLSVLTFLFWLERESCV